MRLFIATGGELQAAGEAELQTRAISVAAIAATALAQQADQAAGGAGDATSAGINVDGLMLVLIPATAQASTWPSRPIEKSRCYCREHLSHSASVSQQGWPPVLAIRTCPSWTSLDHLQILKAARSVMPAHMGTWAS